MKTALYIILAIVVLIGAAAAWFFYSFKKADKLTVPPTATKAERLGLIDNYLTQLHQKGHFNGAVLFAEKGEPLLMKTYGFTDYSRERELTPQSSFRLASVSKQFTAAGILRAAELGLLELDAPIITYIESQHKEVAVRHLLNQTSGIPDEYMRLGEAHRDSIGEVLTNADVVNLIYKFGSPATGKPGDAYAYSNTNYALLAAILESVSGKSFEDFMQAEIFDPLGMSNSRVFLLTSKDTSFTNKTEDYITLLGESAESPPEFLEGVGGDGNVFASPEDFLKWDEFWKGDNGIVRDSLLEQAFLKPTLNDGTTSDYGFGWLITTHNQWHNGSWLGARTSIARNPKAETVLVLLDNSTNFKFNAIITEITKALKPPATATDN
jgi:CubicO group peptidase (beta-lactamase class C family)